MKVYEFIKKNMPQLCRVALDGCENDRETSQLVLFAIMCDICTI